MAKICELTCRAFVAGCRRTAGPSATLPRIPVEDVGVGVPHEVFLKEDLTRKFVWRRVTGIRVRFGRDDKGEGEGGVSI